MMTARYSIDELKKKLRDAGWCAVSADKTARREGTLQEMAEAAHARHVSGKTAGYLQEIETQIEVDLMQLEELWLHLGLPTI